MTQKIQQTIHPTAIIDESVTLGNNITVGPYAVLEGPCTIGDNCQLDAHCMVRAHTTLGKNCHLHPGAVIGDVAQDLAFKNEVSYVEIGDNCVFREGATVHRGTKADTKTLLGNNVYMMVQAHVGHNSTVGNNVILVNGCALGGYATVADGAFLSAFVGIHQFCEVGTLSLVAANIKIDHDVPPFVIVDGSPKSIRRLNQVGLKRAGIPEDEIQAISQAYIDIAAAEDPMEAGKALAENSSTYLQAIGKFYINSKRGVMRRFAL